MRNFFGILGDLIGDQVRSFFQQDCGKQRFLDI